jgi:hypothetical protein
VVAFANVAVQKWRYRADRLGASIEELCTEINAAADLATEYWLTERPEPSPIELRRLEARLVGRQLRLQELLTALTAHDKQIRIAPIESMMPDLYDAMTGGDFRVQLRPLDLERAQMVQARAAVLNGELRRALVRRFRRRWR